MGVTRNAEIASGVKRKCKWSVTVRGAVMERFDGNGERLKAISAAQWNATWGHVTPAWDYFTGIAKFDYKLFAFAVNFPKNKTCTFRRVFSEVKGKVFTRFFFTKNVLFYTNQNEGQKENFAMNFTDQKAIYFTHIENSV